MKNTNVISETCFIEQYQKQTVSQKLNEFCEYTQHKMQHIDKEIIRNVAHILFNTNINFQLQYPIIALRMGLGKSTLIHAYIQFMLSQNPKYGAIVAVERINTIKELCSMYPKTYFGLYGFQKDECVQEHKKWNPNQCKICSHDECYVKTNMRQVSQYPILIMTHERLHIMLQNNELFDKHMFFYSQKGHVKRTDLFIDESPTFYSIDKVYQSTVNLFKKSLHQTYRRDCKSRRTLITYFKPLLDNIQEEFHTEESNSLILSANDHYMFDQYKNMFLDNYYGIDYNSCLHVLTALHYDSPLTQTKQGICKVIPTYRELSNLAFRTFIFDGTANLDKTYPDDALIVDFDDNRQFINTQVYADVRQNLSITKYDKTHLTLVPKYVDIIKEQLTIHDKILLVTFKDYEKEYRNYFNQPCYDNRIYIDHFGNMKGKNDYRECTCIFILGTLYKTDEYYLLQSHLEDYKDIEFVNMNKKRVAIHKDTKELCQDINDFIIQDQAISTSQDVFRLKHRGDPTAKIDIFINHTNKEYFDVLMDYLPGANIQYIEQMQESPIQDRISNYLLEKKKYNKFISKKQLRTDCDISAQAWKAYTNHKSTKEFFKKYNIKNDKYNVRFS